MNKSITIVMGMALLFGLTFNAWAGVIGFDDIGTGMQESVPRGYEGLSWQTGITSPEEGVEVLHNTQYNAWYTDVTYPSASHAIAFRSEKDECGLTIEACASSTFTYTTGQYRAVNLDCCYAGSLKFNWWKQGGTSGTTTIAISKSAWTTINATTIEATGLSNLIKLEIFGTGGGASNDMWVADDLNLTIGTRIAPIATTGAADNISKTSATLHGTVNPNCSATTVTFQYGLTASYGSAVTATTSPVDAYTTTRSVQASPSNLLQGKTYHYRVKAVSVGGTDYGSDQTFSTAGAGGGGPNLLLLLD